MPCPEYVTITPAQYPNKLWSGIKGPIPPDSMVLVMERSILTIKSISVHLGIIYFDNIFSVPTFWTFEKDENMAQILLFPFVMPGSSDLEVQTPMPQFKSIFIDTFMNYNFHSCILCM